MITKFYYLITLLEIECYFDSTFIEIMLKHNQFKNSIIKKGIGLI